MTATYDQTPGPLWALVFVILAVAAVSFLR